jgi:hypothetical protein
MRPVQKNVGLVVSALGLVVLVSSACGDDKSSSTGGGERDDKAGYCELCSSSEDCASGYVCRVVSGSYSLCALQTDDQCCMGECSGTNVSCTCYYLK